MLSCVMISAVKYYICAIASVILWGSSFIADKIAYASFSPLMLCMIRFVISSLILNAVRIMRHDHVKMRREDRKDILLSALFGITAYYAFENVAVSLTAASDASLITASYPAVTVMVGMAFYHIFASRRQIMGIIISMIGVVMLTVTDAGEAASGRLAGNIMLIVNGFFWAFYIYMIRRAAPHYDSVTLSAWLITIGTVLFIPFLFLETPVIQNITPASVSAVLYLSAGCTVLALLLYNYSLKGVSAAAAAVIMNLMPVVGVVCSALILHENISLTAVASGVIIIAGVLISSKK